MRFSACQYFRERGILSVLFENGDAFQVPVEALLGASTTGARWERVRIGETGDYLECPTSQGLTEIPWDRIRCIVDPEFRRHLAAKAATSARRVGSRLRSLRRASGLTQEAVARSAGVDRVTISRIENGRLRATYETLARIVATIGRTMQDLAVEDTPAPVRARPM